MTTAHRIETDRLVLRCWNPEDAELLGDAISSSIQHLEPWMPWIANEPLTIADRADLLGKFEADFEAGVDFFMGFSTGSKRECWGPGVLEIGYWIRFGETGQGFAREAAAALTRVAFLVNQVSRVEIRCDSRNQRSAAIPRSLGFPLETRPESGSDGDLDGSSGLIFAISREEWEELGRGGRASRADGGGSSIRAWDADGERLL